MKTGKMIVIALLSLISSFSTVHADIGTGFDRIRCTVFDVMRSMDFAHDELRLESVELDGKERRYLDALTLLTIESASEIQRQLESITDAKTALAEWAKQKSFWDEKKEALYEKRGHNIHRGIASVLMHVFSHADHRGLETQRRDRMQNIQANVEAYFQMKAEQQRRKEVFDAFNDFYLQLKQDSQKLFTKECWTHFCTAQDAFKRWSEKYSKLGFYSDSEWMQILTKHQLHLQACMQ